MRERLEITELTLRLWLEIRNIDGGRRMRNRLNTLDSIIPRTALWIDRKSLDFKVDKAYTPWSYPEPAQSPASLHTS